MAARKPINEYLRCQCPKGWDRLPTFMLFAKKGEEPYSAGWMRQDGIQFLATVREIEGVMGIHVTVAPIYSLRPSLTKEQVDAFITEQTPKIFPDFFGDRRFIRLPDDPRSPGRHYFSPLDIFDRESVDNA